MLRFSDWVSRMRRMDPPEPEPVIPAERWEEMARAAIEAQTEERRAFAVLREEVRRVSAAIPLGLEAEGARLMLEAAMDRAGAARDDRGPADDQRRDLAADYHETAAREGWTPAGFMADDVRAALAAVLGEETVPHLCTCEHSEKCAGCSEGFMDRCRFELAIRQVLGR